MNIVVNYLVIKKIKLFSLILFIFFKFFFLYFLSYFIGLNRIFKSFIFCLQLVCCFLTYPFLTVDLYMLYLPWLQPHTSHVCAFGKYKKGYTKKKIRFFSIYPPWFCLYSFKQVGQTCFPVTYISVSYKKTLGFTCK